MGQTKQPASKSMESLQRATDTLSTLLAQEVRELNARQKTARKAADKDGPADPGSFKGLKEATHRGGKAGIPCPVQIRLKLSL